MSSAFGSASHTHTPHHSHSHRTMTDQRTTRTRGCSTFANGLCGSHKRRIRCLRRRKLAIANATRYQPSTRDKYTPSEFNPIQPFPPPSPPPVRVRQTGIHLPISLILTTRQFHHRRQYRPHTNRHGRCSRVSVSCILKHDLTQGVLD
jgi:hypothetical protein